MRHDLQEHPPDRRDVAGTARYVPVLVLAIAGFSFAGPLTRLSEAHALTIAIWRLAFSLLVLLPLFLAERGWREWSRLSGRDLALALAAGLVLALHFWSWNASVGLTSVAASVVLVNLHPVIVAIASAAFLHEPPTRLQWLGIIIAMIGALTIAGDAALEGLSATGRRALLGDGLAVVGAVTVAAYYLAGRRLRRTLGLWSYVALVYGTALLVLLAIAALASVPVLGQPRRELAIFAALALGPMLLGHTGMNWALKYLPAFVVSLAVLCEPVGATLLAALLPGIREIPALLTLAGGALVLAGIGLALPRRTAS
ncbi:MAG TPA: DMT family transporter [Gemmatimonadaceae bacterium]|nr:DMT family transporter [Gemmatimonadaceae bacterium]